MTIPARTTRAMLALGAVLMLSLTACVGDTSAPRVANDPPAAERGYTDVVNEVEPSVVTIQTADGLGSGVVLRQDVIVTNAHVVGDAGDVTVVYADGTRSPGAVLATDTTTDLAVVRTERGDLPVPEYRTELPEPGEVALAIGSPLGFQNSVTAGIISGLHRDIPGSAARTRSLADLIQTDAPISPGNSGGALLDAEGRVIGINEAYLPPQTGAVSLGFAIPSATVLDVTEQLIENGEAAHPYLGVSVRQLTPSIRQELDLRVDHGAVVTGVDENGPAATAGVRPGEVIVELDGEEVASVEDLLTALRGTEPGESTGLVVTGDDGRRELEVEIGSRTS